MDGGGGLCAGGDGCRGRGCAHRSPLHPAPVPYTHFTLPTKREGGEKGGGGSLTKLNVIEHRHITSYS